MMLLACAFGCCYRLLLFLLFVAIAAVVFCCVIVRCRCVGDAWVQIIPRAYNSREKDFLFEKFRRKTLDGKIEAKNLVYIA